MPFTYVPVSISDDYNDDTVSPLFSLAIDMPTFLSLITDINAYRRIVLYPARTNPDSDYVYARIHFLTHDTHSIAFPVRITTPPRLVPFTEDLFLLALANRPLPLIENNFTRIEPSLFHETQPIPFSGIRPHPLDFNRGSIPLSIESSIITHRFLTPPIPVTPIDLGTTSDTYLPMTPATPRIQHILDQVTTAPNTTVISFLSTTFRPHPQIFPSPHSIVQNILQSWTHQQLVDAGFNIPPSEPVPVLIRTLMTHVLSQRDQGLLTSHDDPDDPTTELTFAELTPLIPTGLISTVTRAAQFHLDTIINGPASSTDSDSPPPSPVTPTADSFRVPFPYAHALPVRISPRPDDSYDFVMSTLNEAQLIRAISLSTINVEDQASDIMFDDILHLVRTALTRDQLSDDITVLQYFNQFVSRSIGQAASYIANHPTTRTISSILSHDPSAPIDIIPINDIYRRCIIFHLPDAILSATIGLYHQCPCGLLCPMNWHNPLIRDLPVTRLLTVICHSQNPILRNPPALPDHSEPSTIHDDSLSSTSSEDSHHELDQLAEITALFNVPTDTGYQVASLATDNSDPNVHRVTFTLPRTTHTANQANSLPIVALIFSSAIGLLLSQII